MEDIVKEYKKTSNTRFGDFLSNLGVGHILLIGLLLFFLVSMSDNPEVDPRQHYIIYFILGAIIVYLIYKPTAEKKILPEYVAKKIAQEALNEKVREGKQFSYASKVLVTGVCRLKYENDLISGTSGPVSWDIGFAESVRGSKYKKEGVISVHPYTGIVTGIEFRPLGYSGRESRDRDIVPVGVVEGKVKTTEFGKGLTE